MLSKEAQVGKSRKGARGKYNKIPAAMKVRLKERDGGGCALCGFASNISPHHIEPIGSGYANHEEWNLINLDFVHHRRSHDHPEDFEHAWKVFDYMVSLYPEHEAHYQEHLFDKVKRKL